MARTDVISLLAPDTWARLMAIHPCAWNQVVNPEKPYPTDCRSTWLQFGWHDYEHGMILGREDVVSAIATAEENMRAALGFPIAPTWLTGDELEWPYPKRGIQVLYPPVQAHSGHLIVAGIEADTLVVADRAIVYSDRDGDGVDDTGTITITAAEMTAAGAQYYELAVYYPAEYLDFVLYPRTEAWRIRPLTIVRDPTTGDITIWGSRCQFVRPELWLNSDDILQDNDANFLSYVDVYRRYTDISQQAQIVYRGGAGTCAAATCEEVCQTACVQIEDSRLGQVRVIPADYAAGAYTVSSLTDRPSAVRLWYLSGYYRHYNSWIESDWMAERVAQAIVLLSLAYLPDAVCGCSQTRTRYERYREEQDIDSLDAAMAQQYFGVVTKGSVFAASTVRLLDPLYGGGNV